MSNAVATTEQKPIATLRDLLQTERVKQEIATALPKHMTPDRMIRAAMTAMLKTPELANCDRTSFMQAMLTLSQLGLEPDGRMAHLIPFRNNKAQRVDCQLIVDYKGLVELAQRSGKVSKIHADVVCENDLFEYDMGEINKHVVDFRKPRGEAYAAYARVVMKDGTSKCEVMSREEIDAVRARSRAGGSGPWVTDWREMAKKTVFRRCSKWLSLSPELRDVVEADDDQFDHSHAAIPMEPPEKPATRVEAAKAMASRSRPSVESAVSDVAQQFSVDPEPEQQSQDVVGEEEITRLLDAVQALIPDDKSERLKLYQSAGCDPIKKHWPREGVEQVWAWVESENEARKQ